MVNRGLVVLAAVTAVAMIAAALSLHGRAGVTAGGRVGELVLPDLMDDINDVGGIRLERGGETYTLERRGDKWTMSEKGHYAVRFDRVKTALVALAELETVEAKTAKPELYPKLEVEDPGQPDAKSTEMTVLDGDGNTLAALIVGKTRTSAVGVGRTGTYVRKPDEERAWLAEGDLNLPADAVGWLERELVDIGRQRMAAAILTGPDGARIEISRTKQDDADFTLANLPADHKVKSQYTLNTIAWVPEKLAFDDVRPADEVEIPDDTPLTAEFKSFDGLGLTLAWIDRDGKSWVRVSAEVTDDAGEEARSDVEKIRSRAAGWVFNLPSYKMDKLNTALADLIEKKKQ